MSELKTYDQPSLAPVPKVLAVAGAGAAITALVTLLALSGIIVPESVSQAAEEGVVAMMVFVSAVQAVLTFVAGYFKKDAKPTSVVKEIQSKG